MVTGRCGSASWCTARRLLVWLPTLGRVGAEGLEHVSRDARPGLRTAHRGRQPRQQPRSAAGRRLARARACAVGSTVLAKEELFHGPLGPFLRRSGMVMVKTGGSDIDAYRATKAVLDQGDVILLFPEGTRSPTGVVGSGHAGVAMLAAREGVRVLPVGLSGTDRLLGKGQSLPRIGSRVTLRVGEPFMITLDPALPREACGASDEVMRDQRPVDPPARHAARGRASPGATRLASRATRPAGADGCLQRARSHRESLSRSTGSRTSRARLVAQA